jgi:acetylornithine aminotransferase
MTLQQEWESAFLSNYATPSIELVRGVGSRVWDSQGNSYLDLVAGIAVSSLGHGHPAVVDAVTSQVGQIAHTSNLYANQPALALAKKLQAITGQPCKVFFCNDGATANEAAFKLARKHGKGTRLGLVSTDGAFHGRTAAALALTGQPGKRSPFEPLPGDVVFVPYGDSEALKSPPRHRLSSWNRSKARQVCTPLRPVTLQPRVKLVTTLAPCSSWMKCKPAWVERETGLPHLLLGWCLM